ncbi:methylated-DNA--[protein]-cysteine S-methyltransferase [Corynebacterium sp.]|uniref:methylated-DNA--[protein]-cysteine S-methyltransferase n=1 Tax=Corynebacterium sp. TaxID=1720 RepID=UPI0026DBD0C7|nr:methylated-DNA--[protein]-cysteine S-methyltransferase [Corynebacterium sp.]MDO4609638.1 methylated-DNA--[protein]-cysteine S-methyltransferase [Corynebacterium sp.]
MAHAMLHTPVGDLGVAATARGVSAIELTGPADGTYGVDDASGEARAMLGTALGQLREWFAGDRTGFDVPLDVPGLPEPGWAAEPDADERAAGTGVPFRLRALAALREVPWGVTVSYGELAALAGSPRAARAAGGVCAGNPVPLIIPCHRVLPASGALGAFGGGTDMKRALLAREGVRVRP